MSHAGSLQRVGRIGAVPGPLSVYLREIESLAKKYTNGVGIETRVRVEPTIQRVYSGATNSSGVPAPVEVREGVGE